MKEGIAQPDVDEAVDEPDQRPDRRARRRRRTGRSRCRWRRCGRAAQISTALSVSTPSTDRSIEPSRITKVAPSAEHQRDHRRLQDADEIAELRKLGLIARDDGAEQDQHRDRDPAGEPRTPGATRTRRLSPYRDAGTGWVGLASTLIRSLPPASDLRPTRRSGALRRCDAAC